LGGKVAGDSVRAVSADVDNLGAYAVHQPGSRVMVLLFNKATTATTAAINLGRAVSGSWKLYQFSAATDLGLAGSGTINGSSISVAGLPPRSASLLVLPDSDSIFVDGFDQP
jgi:hypothetical protein